MFLKVIIAMSSCFDIGIVSFKDNIEGSSFLEIGTMFFKDIVDISPCLSGISFIYLPSSKLSL